MQDNGLWKSVFMTITGIRMQSNPRMISNFAVTYRCNNSCHICNIWKLESPESEELTLGEIRSFLEENKDFLKGIESVQITGGEPFLRMDLPEIASSMREYLPRSTLWIPTNGMDPEGIVRPSRPC
jgi:molybdenum cofactor biosynthesis enzyme MoaA